MFAVLQKCFCITLPDPDLDLEDYGEEIIKRPVINMFENTINVPWLTLDGITCKCKVVDVYDADTVTLMLPLEGKLYMVKCRLLGIDSAEKRTKNLDEKKVSLEATQWLRELIKEKVIWVKCGDWGKYGGRILGTLYMTEEDMDTDQSINNKIVEMGYAYVYNGKKKKKFDEWYKK